MNVSIADYFTNNINSWTMLFFITGFIVGVFTASFSYFCDEMAYYFRCKRLRKENKKCID